MKLLFTLSELPVIVALIEQKFSTAEWFLKDSYF